MVDGAAVAVKRAHRPGESNQRGGKVEPMARGFAVKFIDPLGRCL